MGWKRFAADKRVAMLITDVQMPIMDGFELADRAREKRPDIPIVLMSRRR
jgi:CheY-like chemotaxis protein